LRSNSSLKWAEVHARRLKRNFLIARAPRELLIEVTRAVCGIQAQVMSAAELALAARVADINLDDVRAALWQERRLVKTYGPRGTLHLLPADELPLWMAALSAASARAETPWYARLKLAPQKAESLVTAIGAALEGNCLTRQELARSVAQRVGKWAYAGIASAWADPASAQAAFRGQLCFGPSQGSRVTFVRADEWIGHWQALDPEESLCEILRRYLKTYGPATYQNFGEWFGLRPEPARALFQEIESELVPVEVQDKHAWLLAADVNDAAYSVKHSLQLVPQYDCYVLGCRFGREQIVPDAARKRISTYGRGKYEGAVGLPVMLIDGIVAGMWERRKRAGAIALRIEPFQPLNVTQNRQLQREAVRLEKFFGAPVELAVGALV
jgi:DNA glycosylase AlkZ-like